MATGFDELWSSLATKIKKCRKQLYYLMLIIDINYTFNTIVGYTCRLVICHNAK